MSRNSLVTVAVAFGVGLVVGVSLSGPLRRSAPLQGTVTGGAVLVVGFDESQGYPVDIDIGAAEDWHKRRLRMCFRSEKLAEELWSKVTEQVEISFDKYK